MRLTYCFFICFFCFGMPAFCDVMSKYGQIQNVQTYSANPFYNPNGSYNQNFPRLVYANGNDVENADCNRIVLGLLQSYCGTRNGCNGMQLSDVRPTIMVQLSQIPNHNYAVACSGFLDTVFAVYMSEQSNGIQRVNFPTVKKSAVEFSFGDGVPDWESEYKEREMELEQLQSQNARGNGNLTATQFPRTIDDISLQDKMALIGDGLKPYKDNHAYMQLGDVMAEWKTPEKKEKAVAENRTAKEAAEGETNFDAGGAEGGGDIISSSDGENNTKHWLARLDPVENNDIFRKTNVTLEQGIQMARWYLYPLLQKDASCEKDESFKGSDDKLVCTFTLEKDKEVKVSYIFDDLNEKWKSTQARDIMKFFCDIMGGAKLNNHTCARLPESCSSLSGAVEYIAGDIFYVEEVLNVPNVGYTCEIKW